MDFQAHLSRLEQKFNIKCIESKEKNLAYGLDGSDNIGIFTDKSKILLNKKQVLALLNELKDIYEDKAFYGFK